MAGTVPAAVTSADGGRRRHGAASRLTWAVHAEPGQAGVDVPAGPDGAGGHGPLFVVADGVGPEPAARSAGQRAVEAALLGWSSTPPGPPHRSLRAAVHAANLAVLDAALDQSDRGPIDRGTPDRPGDPLGVPRTPPAAFPGPLRIDRGTPSGFPGPRLAVAMTALTVTGREAFVAHVGHGGAWLVRGPECVQLTVDHTIAAELHRLRVVTDEQAAAHPGRSTPTRALGLDAGLRADLVRQWVARGDVFVLCSDGPGALLGRAEIGQAVRAAEQVPVRVADELARLAGRRADARPVAIVVVRVASGRRTRPPAGPPTGA